MVHSLSFQGWMGQVAVKAIRRVDNGWVGLQAIRKILTGHLVDWQPIRLAIGERVVVKYFPSTVPAVQLVYGHVERYHRVDG
jgi:hypothetical protein